MAPEEAKNRKVRYFPYSVLQLSRVYGDRLSQEPDRECHNYLHTLFPEPDRNLFFVRWYPFLESTCICFPL